MMSRAVDVHDAVIHTMVAGEDAPVRGCLRIRDGLILDVRVLGSCLCGHASVRQIDAHGHAVLPGFVDGHRHTWQTSFRHRLGGLSIAEYGAAMLRGRAPHFTPEDAYVGTLLGALTAIDSGTTMIVDWAHAVNTPEHADASVQALQDSGVRAQFAYGIPRDGTARWSNQSDLGHPEDLARIHRQLGSRGRITAAMAARGPEMASAEIVRDDMQMARDLELQVSMHVGAGTLGPDVRAVQLLADAGLLGKDITFIHLNSTSDDELELIKEAGAGTCVGPATEMLMPGVGWPVTSRLLAHGLSPALSIDTETASSGSMFDQMRAVLSALPREETAATLTPLDVVKLATVDGAAAIGTRGDLLGVLRSDAVGDLIILDTGAVNLAPGGNDLASVVLAGHAGNVSTVVVDGRVLKSAGSLAGYDIADVAEKARRSVEAVEARMS